MENNERLKYILNYNGVEYSLFEMSNRKRKELINKILKENPITSRVDIDDEQVDEIFDIYNCKCDEDRSYVGADIIFANTVPIRSIEISNEYYTGITFSKVSNQYKHSVGHTDIEKFLQLLTKAKNSIDNESVDYSRFSVIIFSEYYDKYDDNIMQLIGFCIIPCFDDKSNISYIAVPLAVRSGVNEMIVLDISIELNKKNLYEHIRFSDYCDTYHSSFFSYIDTVLLPKWYSIQLLMLNQVVKNIVVNKSLDHNTSLNDTDALHNNHHTKNKLSTYRLNKINISKEYMNFCNTTQHRGRYTMAWYVRGHWRHYKSGKKVFVKPQWRGPLKDLKKQSVKEYVVDLPTNKVE